MCNNKPLCGKLVVLWLVAGVQLQPSVCWHLSLKEMSHADWENLLESVGSSLSSFCLQSLFSSVLEGSHWTLLSVGAQAGLSALAYLRHKDLRPHTERREEGKLEFGLLVMFYSVEKAVFPAIIKHNFNDISNTYIVTCQHFLKSASITSIWNVFAVHVSHVCFGWNSPYSILTASSN